MERAEDTNPRPGSNRKTQGVASSARNTTHLGKGKQLPPRVIQFLRSQRGRWRPRTIELYSRYLSDLLIWLHRGGHDLSEVSTDDLSAWLDDHPQWGPSSTYSATCACRAFYRWFVGEAHSPAEDLPLPDRTPEPQRTLTNTEVHKLLEPINTSTAKGKRDFALILLMLDTGIRASEVCRLKLQHFYLEERRIIFQVKGGRWSASVFSLHAQAALADWLAARADVAKPNQDAVFVSCGGIRPGTPLNRDGLRTIFRKLSQKAGIKLVSPHALRRTFTVMAQRAGWARREMMMQAHWKNAEMIERYSLGLALLPEEIDGRFPGDTLGYRFDDSNP